ncbi:MAG: phosphoribosyl-AMP cyclohydrolase [Candidatus Tokpelaia sp. JSC161]|jgi:phosphoribosyl-AMP cyclohydrolase|nr:MAG: phosphoribosyl-AMP cyclohydrolase [Candidatus Tokpelaia sp. JSC161]
MSVVFSADLEDKNQEIGEIFTPRFDLCGLMTSVVTDACSGDLLMLAYMNAESIRLTLETGIAYFWSRSRKSLWKKGETSGNVFYIEEILIDCDQDALWLKVHVSGKKVACHTGARSCFYRRMTMDNDVIILK